MSLFDDLVAIYPSLTYDDFGINGSIRIHNENGKEFVAQWNYNKPLPDNIPQKF